MNIAFFASSLLSAYWNGAATYYRGIIKALHAHGHHITFYEPVAYDRPQHRDMEPPSWCDVVVYDGTEEAAWRQIEAAHGADMIVKASGVGIFDELLESAVLTLKTPGNLVIFWDVDAPATLDRIESDPADAFHKCIPQYDFILTYGGGFPVVRAYESHGAKLCVPIYNALDPDTHHPVPPNAKFAADLGLLANRLPDREKRVEQFFLEPAAKLPNKRFLFGGNGWSDKSMTPNVRYLGHVYTADHNALNCTCRSVLNICRESMARYGFSPPTRVFEAAGAAACLITDAWEGVEQFFEPETEVLVAHNGDDVAQHVERLTSERARQIGDAAYRRVLAEHTYAHRAKQVEEVLRGAHAPSRAGFGASPTLAFSAAPDSASSLGKGASPAREGACAPQT